MCICPPPKTFFKKSKVEVVASIKVLRITIFSVRNKASPSDIDWLIFHRSNRFCNLSDNFSIDNSKICLGHQNASFGLTGLHNLQLNVKTILDIQLIFVLISHMSIFHQVFQEQVNRFKGAGWTDDSRYISITLTDKESIH